LSCYEIYQHLNHFTRPDLQIHIVRILGMVPIYSVTSFLALVVKSEQKALMLDVLRDCYEGFVIYNFLVLLINYAGGDRHLNHSLELQPRMEHVWPLDLLFPPMKLGSGFMHFVRSACLQFVFVKPAGAIASLYVHSRANSTMNNAVDNLINQLPQIPSRTEKSVYFLVSLINNISVTMALYGLLLFYKAAEPVLRPYKPLPKFLAVKLVIFFSFWQGMALSMMIRFGLITDVEGFTAVQQASGVQDLLICIEMMVAAIGHYYVFSYREVMEYPDPDVLFSSCKMNKGGVGKSDERRPLLHTFGNVVDFRDVLSDAKASIYGSGFEREMRDRDTFIPDSGNIMAD